MVTPPPPSRPASKTEQTQSVLKRLLLRAVYATSDLKAAAGPDFEQEEIAIRRIHSAMINAGQYPPSLRSRRARDLAKEVWENEGGSPSIPVIRGKT